MKTGPNALTVFAVFAVLLIAATPGVIHAQSSGSAPDSPFVVATTAGQLRGKARTGGGAQFLGIPYAEPPVGDLRWREPVPIKPWSGIRNAVNYGATCAQPVLGDWNKIAAFFSSENCLYLNVVTPEWPPQHLLPVMFWIHGGANVGGTGGGPLYNDGTLVNHGVVTVTINYRLGVFGFFAHPELTRESVHHASGNYGLMDQIMALHWVIDNIAKFGGDPRNITVFGQSAGSIDTGLLMTSPLAIRLFQKAIGESGAVSTVHVPPLADAEKYGAGSLAALNLPAGEEGIAAARKIGAKELMEKLNSRATQFPTAGPDVDGWVLRERPDKVFAAGQEAKIPLLIGTTSMEFGYTMPTDRLLMDIDRQAGKLAPKVKAVYGLTPDAQGKVNQPSDPLYGTASQQWTADTSFHCPIASEALWHSAAGNSTYEYELDHAIPGQEAQGAVHSSDLPYVWGYFPKTGNIAGAFGAVDTKLAELMESYWTNFARTGNPNGDSLPVWPDLRSAQTYMKFTQNGEGVMSTRPLRAAQCQVYREFTGEKLKATK
ncbi:MAG TPA: carboxylesterase family protein [Terracidiphilus sp.]|nr:carboxylesterase family protein [Terracidiphilus sp.]